MKREDLRVRDYASQGENVLATRRDVAKFSKHRSGNYNIRGGANLFLGRVG